MPKTYLDAIIADHRRAAARDTRSLDALIEATADLAPTRGFRRALAEVDGLAVIAEVKRRSPSKPDLAVDLDPAEVANAYRDGGATALSVLTDVDHFGGSAEDLRAARAASGLPVLRKDFTVAPHDVIDARLMGADAVLLIAAVLDDVELRDFGALAAQVGLDALVEIHDEAELERAMAVNADLVGVNQRNLVTFDVDSDRALRMAPQMPAGVIRVAESGVRGPEDAAALAAAGYHAVLVGESVVTAGDREGAVRALRSVGSGSPNHSVPADPER